MPRRPDRPTLFPYTTLFRSENGTRSRTPGSPASISPRSSSTRSSRYTWLEVTFQNRDSPPSTRRMRNERSEEHTSELQSLRHLVCRLLLEKKKKDGEQESEQ